MSEEVGSAPVPRALGRYLLFQEIASGGMATVHIGRLVGPAGFARTVAIKRLHPQFAKDPEFISMFLDEARLAARIRHPNVVSTLDVVPTQGELFLVMEYVQGEALSRLMRVAHDAGERTPLDIASAILCQALLGLHAAHEATSEGGTALQIVHRDVSPQNILVGTDGVARVVDFGVAKAASRAYSTQEGKLKGKLAYMAPEQVFSPDKLDRRADIFASSVVLWEMLTGQKLFSGEVGAIVGRLVSGPIDPPSSVIPGLPPAIDALVMRGLSRDPAERFPTARAMAQALEAAIPPAGALRVGEWVERFGGATLQERSGRVARIESLSTSEVTPPGLLDSPDEPTRITAMTMAPARRSSQPDRQEETSKSTPAAKLVKSSGPRIVQKATLGVLIAATAIALGFIALRREDHAGAVTLDEVKSGTAPIPERPSVEPASATTAAPSVEPSGLEARARVEPPPVEETAAVSATAAPSAAPKPPKAPYGGVRPRPANCDPPYVLNPDGSKRFKPECFR